MHFEVKPAGAGSEIRQTAIFDPAGLLGLVCRYALYPIHSLVLGMLRGILRAIPVGKGASHEGEPAVPAVDNDPKPHARY